MCPSLYASIRAALATSTDTRPDHPSFPYLSDARGERCCSKRRDAGEHGTMSKVGHDCPPVMRRRRRALLASKVRRGQGNRISPANNLKGSRAGRKVGYAPCDDQPGSNPFDLRIVVAFGDAILESRRFCEDASGPSGCAPQSSICRGVRKRNYHN